MAGRLIRVENLTVTVVYTYTSATLSASNGDGVRVAQSVNNSTTTYIQDILGLPQVLIEIANHKSQIYIYGLGRLVQVEDDSAEWFLGDALGSVRQLVDDVGNVVLAQAYDPYGQVMSTSGTSGSGYGFTGEQQDAGTGLVFLRARYFAPATGTFLSQDPAPGFAGNPQTMNGWSYAYGNPINLTDPSGQCAFLDCKFPAMPPQPPKGTSSLTLFKKEICGTWPQNLQSLCEQAYDGDNKAREKIYNMIAMAEIPAGLFQASRALRHFLKGTTTPSMPLYFSRTWYLEASNTRAAVAYLKQEVKKEIDTAKDSCQLFDPARNPIYKEIGDINVDPGFLGRPDDRQLVVGAHTLRVNACLALNAQGVGWIAYKFAVYEWFDFRKGADNVFRIPHTGIQVPSYWADQLVDNNMAAEYWTIVRWTDIDWVGPNYLRGIRAQLP